MQSAPVQAEHQWLEQLIGTWTYETTCVMGPDQPPAVTQGRETVRALGPYWVVTEGQSEMGGGDFRMLIQIGFDPALGRFRGTWIGSVMPILWVYDGELDAGRTTLTLKARGPSFAGDGTMADYEDIIELPGDGRRRFRSRTRMPDGTWNEFMRAEYRRTG